jgi:hypothetical protein
LDAAAAKRAREGALRNLILPVTCAAIVVLSIVLAPRFERGSIVARAPVEITSTRTPISIDAAIADPTPHEVEAENAVVRLPAIQTGITVAGPEPLECRFNPGLPWRHRKNGVPESRHCVGACKTPQQAHGRLAPLPTARLQHLMRAAEAIRSGYLGVPVSRASTREIR